MATLDIPIYSLIIALCLLILPIIVILKYRLKLLKPLLISTVRMVIQLILIGIFLKYLFVWNNPIINFSWLTIMILVAVLTAVKSTTLKVKKLFFPVFISFFFATTSVIFYLNTFVIPVKSVFDARYLIVLGGMLLGNSLRGNIVGINYFYDKLKTDSKHYLYVLSLGATRSEALLPYMQESIKLALKPTLASMATMGIVTLPGMMTGVILGGANPMTAIKYQILIMVGIIVSTIFSVILTILLTEKVCFSKFGVLKRNIFRS